MSQPEVVSAEQWQVARDQLLTREKEATRALDALAAARRRLPMVKFDSDYLFEGPEGQVRLIDLFGDYKQLAVYQFMNIGPDRFCPGCSQFIDNVGRLEHIQARDATFVAVSNMPWSRIEPFTRRMEWTMPFYSSLRLHLQRGLRLRHRRRRAEHLPARRRGRLPRPTSPPTAASTG